MTDQPNLDPEGFPANNSELLTALGKSLVSGSLTDPNLLHQTAGPVQQLLPDSNVVKIGGQSMIDRGRKAMFPIIDEIVENLETHQMILGTGAGTRAKDENSSTRRPISPT